MAQSHIWTHAFEERKHSLRVQRVISKSHLVRNADSVIRQVPHCASHVMENLCSTGGLIQGLHNMWEMHSPQSLAFAVISQPIRGYQLLKGFYDSVFLKAVWLDEWYCRLETLPPAVKAAAAAAEPLVIHRRKTSRQTVRDDDINHIPTSAKGVNKNKLLFPLLRL